MSPEVLSAMEKVGGLFIALVVLWGVYRLVKHLIDQLAAPLVRNLSASWEGFSKTLTAHETTLTQVRDSLIRIEAAEANETEERRYMRENFGALLANLSKLVTAFNTHRGEQVFRDEQSEGTHEMVTDIHREIVRRDTGVHRREEIERKKRERDSGG